MGHSLIQTLKKNYKIIDINFFCCCRFFIYLRNNFLWLVVVVCYECAGVFVDIFR